MQSCLSFVKQTAPAAGVFENVLGMELVDVNLGDRKSALKLVCKELDMAGYGVRVVHLDASTWHKMVRQRFISQGTPIHTEQREGKKPNMGPPLFCDDNTLLSDSRV